MDFDSMLLPELKAEAKKVGLKGYSTMKKAELIEALKVDYLVKAAESKTKKVSRLPGVESRVDAIKASIRNARDARRMAGVSAGREASVTRKMTAPHKAMAYMASRGDDCKRLTPKQARRVRKTYNKLAG